MKYLKYIIIFFILIILYGIYYFIISNRLLYNDSMNKLYSIVNTYQNLINTEDFSNKDINGTIEEEYHYIDAHGGQGLTLSNTYNYLYNPSNNYFNIFNDSINIKDSINLYLQYFNYKDIESIKIDKIDYIKNIINIDNKSFNKEFNSNFKNITIQFKTKGIIKKISEYIITLDNYELIISLDDNTNIILNKDNKEIISSILYNDNQIKINYNDNSITIIKQNNGYIKYNLLINKIPINISKKDNTITLNISYEAKKYHDLKLVLTYFTSDSNTILDKDNTDQYSNIGFIDYYLKLKELN